jgi:hypothetical protein
LPPLVPELYHFFNFTLRVDAGMQHVDVVPGHFGRLLTLSDKQRRVGIG